ncbi:MULTISPECIES: bifunctional DedA family/phosphatase PAP2 family protein [Inquilinus]|uniref:Undecaprenyl-diphosphatase n=1 Tax=Inquilinus ginsengisoli TaxID=363840 RepID=A0ABU1JLM4_9PROT|nr:bifunctional DedA family/phosphatase PAP2 family protein [Inquilinus ginsengisoli]MDR6289522.1 undecaprenyl-diphosphatase [Inquilinus ginsengisoli]
MSGITQAVMDFIGQHPQWAGLLIFLIALTESVAVIGLFIPGSPILIAVGAVVGLGHLPLWPILLWATAGAIIGDGVSYELGRRYSATILGTWPVSRTPALIARGEAFFRRHGGKSIALGRFLPMLRPMVPMVAGALGLRPGLFYAVNIASALVWAPAHILGGALLGASLGTLGAVSGRLVAIVVVLALALWILIAATRWTWRRLAPLLDGAQQAAHRWAVARGGRPAQLLARLLDPEAPDLRVMALLGALVLILVAGFVNLLRLVAAHGELARADAAISGFIQGLRTPWSDAVLTAVTMLGDGTTITALVVIAIAWLLLRRAWHRAGGVAIAVAVTAGFVPLVKGRLQILRPTELYSGADAFSFPSGHAAFSAVLYGILGWLVARGLPGRWQALPLTLAAALVGLICASRIYLAAHWPSDVAAGLIFGLGMTIAFAMVFRRSDARQIRPRAFAGVLLLALAAVGGWHVATNYPDAAAMYARRDTTVTMAAPDWRAEGWRRLPPARTDLGGDVEQPFRLQWAGPPAALAAALAPSGWREPTGWGLVAATGFLDGGADAATLPVLPVLQDGHLPALTLIRPAAGGLSRQVLRLWPSGVALEGGSAILLGAPAVETIRHPLGLLSAVEDQDDGPLPDLPELRALPNAAEPAPGLVLAQP